jgi:cytochrome c-type biogenesis protein CcmF
MDPNKTMTFVDLRVIDRNGKDRGTLSPARFEYRTHPNQPSSEVAVMHSFRDDLYVVLGSLTRPTGRASLQVHVNPLVSWIWAGVLVLMVGALISLWPVTSLRRVSVAGYARAIATVISAICLSLLLASLPAQQGPRHDSHSTPIDATIPQSAGTTSGARSE